jgi:hypothetical protein
MIWIIIGLVISLWIWFSLIHTKGTKIYFEECIVILIMILTAVSACTLFGDAIISYTDTEYSYDELDSSTKIIALKDRPTTEGNFFLGFGSVDNSDYYCYYTENDAGDIKFNKISTNDNVKFRYCSSEEQPNVKIYNQVKKEILVKEPNIWTSPLSDYISYHKYSAGDVIKTSSSTYHNHQQTVIYIPEGSIEQNYKIDME